MCVIWKVVIFHISFRPLRFYLIFKVTDLICSLSLFYHHLKNLNFSLLGYSILYTCFTIYSAEGKIFMLIKTILGIVNDESLAIEKI